ncbi:hypothetical protein BH11MYX4_BH11MYX4_59820 [soil metagenome]
MTFRISSVLVLLASTSLAACSSEVLTTSAPPTQPPAEAPADPADPPKDPPPVVKPPVVAAPTLTIDSAFAGGAGITDATNSIYAATPAPDGKILVSLRKAGGASGWGNGTIVSRYLASGAIDATFGTGGSTASKLVANPQAIALDPQGRVLVGGSGLYDPDTTSDSGREIVVARFTPQGALDTTYGTNGRAILNFSPANTFTTGLRVRPDGGALVAVYGRTSGKATFGIFLLGAAGTTVNAFGTNGFIPSADPLDGALVLPDGRSLVPDNGGLWAYDTNGAAAATSFGAIPAFVAASRVGKDGSITMIRVDTKFHVDRYTATGAKDTTFTSAVIGNDPTDLAVRDDGSVVVAVGGGLSWLPKTGGTVTELMKSVNAGKLAMTNDGKLLVTTAADSAKVLRYTF